MFTCLNEVQKLQTSVVEGMIFSIKRRRFTLVDENEKSKSEVIPLRGRVISTHHPKFYLVEINSNDQKRTYIETYRKDDFQSRILEEVITIH
jgi:hypothetical protein